MSVFGADLNVSLKFLAQKTIVDRNHITTLQVRRDLVDPVEGSLIEPSFINRPLDEYEVVAVEGYQFLRSITDQAHGHGVQHFVGKMDTREWFRCISLLNLIPKRLDPSAVLLFQIWKSHEYPIAPRAGEFRQAVAR